MILVPKHTTLTLYGLGPPKDDRQTTGDRFSRSKIGYIRGSRVVPHTFILRFACISEFLGH